MMTIGDAMTLIDAQVAAGARLTVSDYPSWSFRGRPMPGYSIAQLQGVEVNSVRAAPTCCAATQPEAIIGLGELLRDWQRG